MNQYYWQARYDTGTTHDERRWPQGFKDLPREGMTELVLRDSETHEVVATMKLSPPTNPVFFRRRRATISFRNNTAKANPIITCIGWTFEMPVASTIGSYMFLTPNGIVLSDDIMAV